MDLGREKLSWSRETWDRIDRAVAAEVIRTSTTRKVLPLFGPVQDGTTSVPSDVFDAATGQIDEGLTTALIEIASQFTLTTQQVATQDETGSATTAAVSRANLIAIWEDMLVLQGDVAGGVPVVLPATVAITSGRQTTGLMRNAAAIAVNVARPAAKAGVVQPYGENTVAEVNNAVGQLQTAGHYGPYALILSTLLFADAHARPPRTLTIPADRIKPVVASGFFSTGCLPNNRGLLVSLGGNSMDVVRCGDVLTAFSQIDTDGRYRFRVFERFALRLKRGNAVARLEFA